MEWFNDYIILNCSETEHNKNRVALIKVNNSNIIDSLAITPKKTLTRQDKVILKQFIGNNFIITIDYKLCKNLKIPDKSIIYPDFDIHWAEKRFEIKVKKIYDNISKAWENKDNVETFIGCYLTYQDIELYKYICENAKL